MSSFLESSLFFCDESSLKLMDGFRSLTISHLLNNQFGKNCDRNSPSLLHVDDYDDLPLLLIDC